MVVAQKLPGEHFWRMPMEVTSYWECIKSGIADIVKRGSRQAGFILAVIFLKQVSSCNILPTCFLLL